MWGKFLDIFRVQRNDVPSFYIYDEPYYKFNK